MFVEYREVFKLEQKSRAMNLYVMYVDCVAENGEYRNGQDEMQIGFVNISFP